MPRILTFSRQYSSMNFVKRYHALAVVSRLLPSMCLLDESLNRTQGGE